MRDGEAHRDVRRSGVRLSRLRLALTIARRGGLHELWFRTLAASAWYRRLLLFEREVGDPPERPPMLPVTAELLNETKIDDYLAFRTDAKRADMLVRLRAGDLCFILRLRGRIVHACWASLSVARIEYLGCQLPLRADEAYVYDTFTGPDVRSMSLGRVRKDWMERHLGAAGYRRCLYTALPENTAGLRFIEGIPGNRRLGTIGCLTLGRWRRDFIRLNEQLSPTS